MRLSQYLNQATALIAAIIISAPALADHTEPSKQAKPTPTPTVKSIAASLHNTLASLIPRPITPADSGILMSMGRADRADFTVSRLQTEAGQGKVIGGNTEGDIGASLGFRKALGQRWSLDTQYERQRVIDRTTAQTAEDVSKSVAHWASMSGVYHAPITPKVSVHAGGGAFFWQRERKTSTGETAASTKETGTNVLLQMGVGYRVTPKAKIEGNVQRFFLPDKAINRISLGVVIHTD